MFEFRVAVGREPSGISWSPRTGGLAPIGYTFLRNALARSSSQWKTSCGTPDYISAIRSMQSWRNWPGLMLGFRFLASPINLPMACCFPPWTSDTTLG